MADLTEQNDMLPDTPYEHRVCSITFFCTVLFIAAGAYYLLGPAKNELAHTMVMITGGIFLLALLNFFTAAFGGKLCGRTRQ